MIKFKTLSLRNFLCFGNVPTVVNLDQPGTTLVLGQNLDNTDQGTGNNGVGKALPLNANIKIPSGWKKMKDISVGDILQAPDGRTTVVNGVYPQGVQPVYRLTFADGRTSTASADHLWAVKSHMWKKDRKSNDQRVLTTEQVKKHVDYSQDKQAYYNLSIPTINHPDNEDSNVPLNCYLLGVLLGDGGLSQSQVKISSADLTLIEECKQILENEYDQTLTQYSEYDWAIKGLSRRNTIIRNILNDIGLHGTTSSTKFIPQQYLERTSKQQKLDLLAGLLDTDGTVGKTKNVSFCTASKELANNVQYLIRSLGGKATITERAPHYYHNEKRIEGVKGYNVSIRYKNPNELFRLHRKQQRLSEGETQYANEGLRIVSVESVGYEECQCIFVDHPDHLFITDDFVVTHNTTLINALSYAVYDKPIADISKDNLVNNINKKNMEVTIEFEKGEHHYLIKRARKMKAGAGGNYVQLFKDQKDITPDSAKNTNNEIEQIMGIPYELFVRIVAFSATHIPFLDLPVRSPTSANQTDIIEELFDLKTLSEKAETLKEKIKDTEQSLQMQQNRVEQLEKEHERHEKQLENAQKRVDNWERDRSTQIKQLKEKIKRVENVDIDGQKKLHDNLHHIDTELKQTKNTRKDLERQIEDQNTIVDNKNQELTHLRDEKCPYCLQKYQSASEKIKQCETERDQASSTVSDLVVELEQTNQQIDTLETQHEQTKQQITVKDLDELIDIKNKIDVYQNKLQELENGANPYTEPLDELKQVELEYIDKSSLNDLKDTLDHQKFLLKLLTKKDSFVRKALLNKNLPFLNQRLAYYLSELGLPHTVEFTHEMTASISQFGSPLDFGSLSNGQRARVNLALSFAFRDVLQSMHEYINVCMLDEALDVGLDTVGVQNAARMIKQKARDEGLAVYVISHRDEIENAFDYNMIVKMSKGFSYIEYDQ